MLFENVRTGAACCLFFFRSFYLTFYNDSGMSVESEKAPDIGGESKVGDNPVDGPGHYSSDISQRNRLMAINDTHFIRPSLLSFSALKPHKLFCGLNAINNCFGYKLADNNGIHSGRYTKTSMH